jgi:hypothetical protein
METGLACGATTTLVGAAAATCWGSAALGLGGAAASMLNGFATAALGARRPAVIAPYATKIVSAATRASSVRIVGLSAERRLRRVYYETSRLRAS